MKSRLKGGGGGPPGAKRVSLGRLFREHDRFIVTLTTETAEDILLKSTLGIEDGFRVEVWILRPFVVPPFLIGPFAVSPSVSASAV